MSEKLKEPKIKEFVISRVFDAPRDLLWKVCTEPAHIEKWFAPEGFKSKVVKMDLRAGGMQHYYMESPDGNKMWGKCVYKDIKAPEKIVYINSFSDEKGGITRHPMSATWPLEMHTTYIFSEKNGKTTLTITWVPINSTEAERKTFDENHPGMTQGWTGTLDHLTAYLKKARA